MRVTVGGSLSLLDPSGISASGGAGSTTLDSSVTPGGRYLSVIVDNTTPGVNGIATFAIGHDGSLHPAGVTHRPAGQRRRPGHRLKHWPSGVALAAAPPRAGATTRARPVPCGVLNGDGRPQGRWYPGIVGSLANPPRVLVVDDEPVVRDVLSRYLAREGFTVTEAADGSAALEAVEEVSPSVVLLDLMLPRLSGLDVLRALRLNGDLPVIILSARASEQERIQGLQLGADDYVVKPYSPGEVVARVHAVLRRAAGDRGACAWSTTSWRSTPCAARCVVDGRPRPHHPQGVRAAAPAGVQPRPRVHARAAAGDGVGIRVDRRLGHGHACTSAVCGRRSSATRPSRGG